MRDLPRNSRRLGASLLLAASIAPTTPAQLLADSVADFSGIQGQNNWVYLYSVGTYNVNALIPFPFFTPGGPPENGYWHREEGSGGYWTAIWDKGCHPNGTTTSYGRKNELNTVTRRWIAPVSGTLNVSGVVKMNDGVGGNGVVGAIHLNGELKWAQAIASNNTQGVPFQIQLCVSVGQWIDFTVDPKDSNDLVDSTGYIATIHGPVVVQPLPTYACPGDSPSMSVTAAPIGTPTYQWRRNAIPLSNGPTGSGSAIFGATTKNLIIQSASSADNAEYDCVVSDACGSMPSDPAPLIIRLGGYADCDNNAALDIDDFICFQTHYAIQSPYADCDADAALTIDDFICFQTLYAIGC